MAQIKTVFPDAYTLRQEKNVPTFNSNIKKGSYQLTAEPLIVPGRNTLPFPFVSLSFWRVQVSTVLE